MADMEFSRKRGTFLPMYTDGAQALRSLDEYADDVLDLCAGGASPFNAIRTAFELADRHYKEAMRIANHLLLWHNATVGEIKFSDWPPEWIRHSILIHALAKMASSKMSELLSVYREWLREDQLVKANDIRA